MAIQNQTFKTRLLTKSGLSPQALLVALVIAELRYAKKLHSHEPLVASLAELAKSCHMTRNTLQKYLKEATESGWIACRPVYRDGKQQPSEYRLGDPESAQRAKAEGKGLPSETDPKTVERLQKLRANPSPISVKPLPSVLRSKYNGAADDAAPRGGGGSDEQGQIKTAVPGPALAGARPDPAETTDRSTRRLKWPDGFVYNGRDPSAVDHLAVVPATPDEITAALRRDRDPVLAVGCPVPWCRARPWRPCKDPDHRSGYHGQRILAASESAVSA